MKRYVYTTYTCLMSLLFIGISLFSSCSNEVAVDPGTKADGLPSLSIVANVDAGIVTRAIDDPTNDLFNQDGSWINNLTVFLFAVDAADTATPLLTKTVELESNPTSSNQANKIQLTGQDLSNAGISIGSHVAIYAIANHTTTLTNVMTKKQVLEQTEQLPKYVSNGLLYSLVPMTGSVSDYTITSTVNQTINLSLERAVLRINIDIIDAEFDIDKHNNGEYSWQITSVKLYNDYATTYLWNEGIPTNPTCRTEDAGIGITDDSSPTSNNFPAGTHYLNCNEASTAHQTPEPIKIKVSGLRGDNSGDTPFEYTVDLKRADNTYIFERNTNINVTLTLRAGTIDIKTEAIPWDAEITTNEGETLMRQEPKANCYIVKPESAILIPVSQVQDVYAFNNAYATAINPNQALTAKLTWTDVKGSSSQKGLANDAPIAKVELLGDGPEALLLIVTGTEVGNSVVSVFAGKNFIWSWHIWVTEYDPETSNNISAPYTFMDRNLGAKTNEPDPNGHNSTGVVGTYYQWGRPIPFPSKDPSSTNSNASSPSPIYDADGNTVNRIETTDISLIGNPDYFFTNGTHYSGSLQLWNSDGNKTPLDPCPAGWRVPIKDAWNNVVVDELGANGVQTSAGFYPISQAYKTYISIEGWFKPFLWTANTSDKNGQPYAFCYSGPNAILGEIGYLYDYYAVPVRCVKE